MGVLHFVKVVLNWSNLLVKNVNNCNLCSWYMWLLGIGSLAMGDAAANLTKNVKTHPIDRHHDFCMWNCFSMDDVSQHWFRKWLGDFRQQAITWTNFWSSVQCHDTALISQWVTYMPKLQAISRSFSHQCNTRHQTPTCEWLSTILSPFWWHLAVTVKHLI